MLNDTMVTLQGHVGGPVTLRQAGDAAAAREVQHAPVLARKEPWPAQEAHIHVVRVPTAARVCHVSQGVTPTCCSIGRGRATRALPAVSTIHARAPGTR